MDLSTNRRALLALFASLLLFALPAAAQAEIVAVAAGIAPAVEEVLAAHVERGGEGLEIVTGSCGALAKQIVAEAPYQMLLLSEPRWPQWLQERGLLRDSATFALGKLALWWPKEEAPDLEHLPSPLAVPDPETTAYGLLGKVYLEERELWETLKADERVLLVASAPTGVLTVKSGAAAAAFVPVGTEIKAGGSVAVIAEKTTEMIGGLLPSAGPDSRAFWAFCLSAQASPIWEKWGYEAMVRP